MVSTHFGKVMHENAETWNSIFGGKNLTTKGHNSADMRDHFSAELMRSPVFSIAHFCENLPGWIIGKRTESHST